MIAPPVTRILLLPGDYFVGDQRHQVRTLLGSCVSITLWHRRARIGAMSHYLLSGAPGPGSGGAAGVRNARYGEDALALMLADLRARGIDGRECEAKVFGGARVSPFLSDFCRIGQRNGRSAHELLARHGIEIVAASLYGHAPRQIIFDIHSGDVWNRCINASADTPAAAREPA